MHYSPLHVVMIPVTIESAIRLKYTNPVLLSTEGCRDRMAPFSFSSVVLIVQIESLLKALPLVRGLI